MYYDIFRENKNPVLTSSQKIIQNSKTIQHGAFPDPTRGVFGAPKMSTRYPQTRRKGAPIGAPNAALSPDADLASGPEKPHVKDTPGGTPTSLKLYIIHNVHNIHNIYNV